MPIMRLIRSSAIRLWGGAHSCSPCHQLPAGRRRQVASVAQPHAGCRCSPGRVNANRKVMGMGENERLNITYATTVGRMGDI